MRRVIQPFIDTLDIAAVHSETLGQLESLSQTFEFEVAIFQKQIEAEVEKLGKQQFTQEELKEATERLALPAKQSRELIKQADLLYKLIGRLIDLCENELAAKESDLWVNREIAKCRKATDAARQVAVEQLKQVRYFHKQAAWLIERFPDGKLRDVEGLVKLVDRSELAANDWSLTPGRYVGVAPDLEEEGFDFEEALREIHIELEGLNSEAVELAAKISSNFKGLGI